MDRLTAVAKDITTGDRGRRLRPSRADTELGRAASAFDGMLDALEDSERRAQQAAEAAQRAEAATRQFLVDAAHELRTPIAGIQAAAEQLIANAGQQDDPEARGQVPAGQPAAVRCPSCRTTGRRHAGPEPHRRRAALDRHDTDLAAIADAEAQRAAMLAPQLAIVRTGLAQVTVLADPTRIAQILSNLLDNARRHTPADGSITIDLSADGGPARSDGHRHRPGHADDERLRIFERLVRLDAGRARDHGGAGLGLSIARALARAHGGDLVCVPHDGGAQFRLSLPLG